MNVVLTAMVFVVLLIATVTDLRAMRIPNWLTFSAMFAGLALHGGMQGLDGFFFSLGGLALGLGLMAPAFWFNAMGAGDVKLMAAVGAALGAEAVFSAFLWSSIAGGVYAMVILLFHLPMLKVVWRSFKAFIVSVVLMRDFAHRPSPEAEKRLPKLCYGAAIAGGTVFSMYLSGRLGSDFFTLMSFWERI